MLICKEVKLRRQPAACANHHSLSTWKKIDGVSCRGRTISAVYVAYRPNFHMHILVTKTYLSIFGTYEKVQILMSSIPHIQAEVIIQLTFVERVLYPVPSAAMVGADAVEMRKEAVKSIKHRHIRMAVTEVLFIVLCFLDDSRRHCRGRIPLPHRAGGDHLRVHHGRLRAGGVHAHARHPHRALHWIARERALDRP